MTAPDRMEIDKKVAEKIVKVLTAHVGDFICDHDLQICFCDEKEILQHMKKEKEKQNYRVIPDNL